MLVTRMLDLNGTRRTSTARCSLPVGGTSLGTLTQHQAPREAHVAHADLLVDLLDRVRVLEDERSVVDRLHAYGHTIDYGLEDAWLDCFTGDAVFEVVRGTSLSATYRGHPELGEFIRGHTRAPDVFHKHVLVEPRLSLSGSTAEVSSYFMRVDALEQKPVIRSFGRYHDRLRRCSDGIWRFTARVVEVEAHVVPGMSPPRD